MNKWLYRLLAASLYDLVWGGELLGMRNLPKQGPAIFISNHHKALGPIAVSSSLPLILHFWIHAHMLDGSLAADYLRQDFIEPQLKVPAPYSRWVSAGLSRITVPLLRSLGGIPAYHDPDGMQATYKESVDVLEAGGYLLIFPEDPNQPEDPLTKMSAFQKGFTRLGEFYFQRTHRSLDFYPVMVHGGRRIVRIDRPLRFNPINNPANERMRLKHVLEDTIRRMYLEAESGEQLTVISLQ